MMSELDAKSKFNSKLSTINDDDEYDESSSEGSAVDIDNKNPA